MKDNTEQQVPDWAVSTSALVDGVWTLLLEGGATKPQIEVLHRHRRLDRVTVEASGAGWRIAAPLPISVLTEGLESVHLVDRASGITLASLNVAAGRPVATDLAEELALLRDEVELLKRAFRRTMAK